MPGLGSIINSVAIFIGALVGKFAGGKLPDKVIKTVMSALGLFVAFLGVQMSLDTQNVIVVLVSLVLGTIVGSIIDIEKALDKLGDKIKKRFDNKGESTFTQGFVAASIIYCVGPMAIMGALNDGLTGDITILITKAIIDGISSIAFASTLGIGVGFSAFLVLIYQGLISIFAKWIAPIMTTGVITEMTAVGGIILMAIGVNIVLNTKIKTGNMLPALFFAIAIASFVV